MFYKIYRAGIYPHDKTKEYHFSDTFTIVGMPVKQHTFVFKKLKKEGIGEVNHTLNNISMYLMGHTSDIGDAKMHCLGVYQLICGHRRFLACKSLGYTEIPAFVFDSNPEDDNWFMLSENLQRDDLSEVEKAEKLHDMMVCDTPKLTTRQIAQKLGFKDHGYVVRLLQLHGFPIEVKEEIKSGNIAFDTVKSINKLETPEEQTKVVSYAVNNELNRKQVDNTVEIIKELPQEIRSKLTDEPEYTISNAKEEYVPLIYIKLTILTY